MNELKLKKSFDKYFDAPIEVWKSFTDLCEEVKFKKNEVIKSTGQTEKFAYFILEGACGVFLWKENNFVCLDIVLENNFFADHMSLITNQSSLLETMALEKTNALRISTNSSASGAAFMEKPWERFLSWAPTSKTSLDLWRAETTSCPMQIVIAALLIKPLTTVI